MLKKSILTSLVLILGMPSFAFASGGPGGALLWINFIIFAALLYYFLKKPLAEAWKARVERLDSEIRKGAIALEAAQKELAMIEAKYADIEQNISDLKVQIKEEAEHEKSAILKQAEADKLTLLEHARKNIEIEIAAQKKLIKKKFAEEICNKAEEKLKAEFNAEYDRAYRQSSLEAAGKGIKSLASK